MKTRVYLDNCCFNRPFDDLDDLVVRLETEAKMHVQRQIRSGEIELAWSFILDYENAANPYKQRREFTDRWKYLSAVNIGAEEEVFRHAITLEKRGIRHKDALHIACAVQAHCRYFLTTDKGILKKAIQGVAVLNPLDYVRIAEGGE